MMQGEFFMGEKQVIPIREAFQNPRRKPVQDGALKSDGLPAGGVRCLQSIGSQPGRFGCISNRGEGTAARTFAQTRGVILRDALSLADA